MEPKPLSKGYRNLQLFPKSDKLNLSMYLTGHQAVENVVERRQDSTHSSPQHETEATLRLHAPAALTPNIKAPYPLKWKLGWSRNRSDGLEKRESCLCWETNHKCSVTQSPYRLFYPCSFDSSVQENTYSSTLSLTSELDGGRWSTPRLGRITSGENPGTHCIGGWVGPRASLDVDRVGGKMYLWEIYCATGKVTSTEFRQGLHFIPGVYKLTREIALY